MLFVDIVDIVDIVDVVFAVRRQDSFHRGTCIVVVLHCGHKSKLKMLHSFEISI